MDPEPTLRTLGRYRRRIGEQSMTGYPQIDRLRRRMRRQAAVRLWTGRILVTTGYIGATGLVVALMMSL